MSQRIIKLPIKIVLYREDGLWVAHCLEFDLCGHGQSQDAAIDMLKDAIEVQTQDALVHNNLGNLLFSRV